MSSPSNQRKNQLKTRIILISACFVWAAAIVAGMLILWSYKSSPGSSGRSHPTQWPANSQLRRNLNGPTLLMFSHPHCPCTRASMSELARLTARFQKQIKTLVIFSIPEGAPEDWEQTQLVQDAKSVADTKVVFDPYGREAINFGVETSGHVMLYSNEGMLQFSGGITAVRGHEGGSFGQQRIISVLTTGRADRYDSPIFGCALLGPPKSNHIKEDGLHHASN